MRKTQADFPSPGKNSCVSHRAVILFFATGYLAAHCEFMRFHCVRVVSLFGLCNNFQEKRHIIFVIK